MYHGSLRHLITLPVVAVVVSIAVSVNAGEAADMERRLAEEPTSIPLMIAVSRAYLGDAQRGDGAALKKAEAYLDRALSLSPDNPQILVLHGSVSVLKGRDAELPVMKMRHVQNGLKEMDRAVELAPMDFGIRYRRGAYCLNLPDIFERAGTAIEDFEHLLMMAERAPESLSSEERAAIRLSLAQAKLKVGEVEEARALLESVLADSPGTAYADEATAMIDKIDG